MSGTRTNRLELLRLRRRRTLVEQGVDILTGKKDALLNEFRHIVKDLREIRQRLEMNLNDAARSLVMARAQEPDHFLATAAMASVHKITFGVTIRKIWGVKAPRLDFPDAARDPFQRGTAPGYRSMAVDGTAEKFEKTINTLAASGAAEFQLLEIGGAIKRTNRRINALNMTLLPEINSGIMRISSRLEEMEREDRFRLKRYKSLKENDKTP